VCANRSKVRGVYSYERRGKLNKELSTPTTTKELDTNGRRTFMVTK
jgi:hypothetical protein